MQLFFKEVIRLKNHNDSIGKWISITYRHLQNYMHKELKPYNIGKGQFIFLMILLKNDGIIQEELSNILDIDKGTTARALKKLEIHGYIERKQDSYDKRAFRVYVTEKGKQIKPVLIKIKENATNILATDFTKEERKITLTLLEKMAVNISDYNNNK